MKYRNLDSNDSIFFDRELAAVKSRTYDVKYPQLKFASGLLIPISGEAGPGASSIIYQQWDQMGIGKIISNYADDLPRADVKGAEFSAVVRSIGMSYGWNIQEIQAARMAGRPLEQRRANAARRANDQKVNSIAFLGDTASNLQGLNTNPNISAVVLAADGVGALTTFASKVTTPDLIIRDLNRIANKPVEITNGVEIPDTMLLPLDVYNLIATTRIPNTDISLLKYFLATNPYIKSVEWLTELSTAGAGGITRAFAYRKDPEALTLEIPQSFEQLAPQETGLEVVIPCHSRIGGVLIYYPLSIAYADGV